MSLGIGDDDDDSGGFSDRCDDDEKWIEAVERLLVAEDENGDEPEEMDEVGDEDENDDDELELDTGDCGIGLEFELVLEPMLPVAVDK